MSNELRVIDATEVTEDGIVIPITKVETEPGVFVVEIKRLYSTATAAKIMELSTASINRMIRDGEIVARQTRSGKRITHDEMIRFINKYLTTPGSTGDTTAMQAGRKRSIEARKKGLADDTFSD